jgi:hypothetical protein
MRCPLGSSGLTLPRLECCRVKWASQVRETVKVLREIGVIWGVGKADNVLVDMIDNAWLIA